MLLAKPSLGLVALASWFLPTHGRTESLREAFAGDFLVGVAVGTDSLMTPEPDALELIARQYNALSPENLLKWAKVHPAPGRYDFEAADRYVEFGERHGMKLLGHTLVWHSQTPGWVFKDRAGRALDRAGLLDRMRSHIEVVVGRYRGRIDAWDVVNEALNDDGTLRDSPWRRIIGDDYVRHAFRYAAAADPNAKLYYNDYGLHLPAKRDGVVRLIWRLQAAGCRVDGIGMQGHYGMDSPSETQIDESIRAFAAAAGSVVISELDVNVLPWPGDLVGGADVARRVAPSPELDPYADGLPPAMQRRLADRYASLFRLFRRHRGVIDRVTFWGVDDGRSWHNDWPVPGRAAHSLLFDRKLQPKPAFHAVMATAKNATRADR